MKKKMYKYIYQTTNLVNRKIYIGQHTTNKINDYYLGSGTLLKRAINKYSKENFRKEIIIFCETYNLLNKIERLIVNEDFVERNDTYNLTIGGFNSPLSESIKEKISKANSGEGNGMYGKIYIYKNKKYKAVNFEELNEYLNHGWKKGKVPGLMSGKNNGMYGKHHTMKSRKLMSKNRKGTTFIHKDNKTKRIQPDKLNKYLSDDWKLGCHYSICKNYKTLHKNGKEIRIPEEKVNEYIENGWEFGHKDSFDNSGKKNGMYDKMVIYKNDETMSIKREEYDEYKKLGWKGGGHDVSGENNGMYGRKQSKSTKKKISKSLKGKIAHNKGKKAINKDGKIKYIFKKELEEYLQNGWQLGMKPRNKKKE